MSKAWNIHGWVRVTASPSTGRAVLNVEGTLLGSRSHT